MALILLEEDSGQYLTIPETCFFLGGDKADAISANVLRRWYSHDVQVRWDASNNRWFLQDRELHSGDALQLGDSSRLTVEVLPPSTQAPPLSTSPEVAAFLSNALGTGGFGCDPYLAERLIADFAVGGDSDLVNVIRCHAESVVIDSARLMQRVFAIFLLGELARKDPASVRVLASALEVAPLRIAVAKALRRAGGADALEVLRRLAGRVLLADRTAAFRPHHSPLQSLAVHHQLVPGTDLARWIAFLAVHEHELAERKAATLVTIFSTSPVTSDELLAAYNAGKRNFKDVVLTGVNLESAVLTRVNLEGANLEGAVLTGANLEGASLEGASFNGANLTGANLKGARSFRARFNNASLTGANLEGVHLLAANLEGASFNGANLIGANLHGTFLTGANLEGAVLTGADLKNAYADRPNLKNAQLERTRLKGAHLTGANLISANLISANLINANLRGADLTGANLRGADLTGANLTGANLRGADLTGANLTGADLTGASLEGARRIRG
ncbi:pentapeptide repeat-containing protein [Sorangium sp. So ce388]|uniref:pentapeptide repeat-containing protein n=1 Tax=Sorangium sp. So ce388 TaxID=3133309 RepID=UPI003F5BE9DA